MVPAAEAAARLQQIDDLQDDVLRQLDELERRTAEVLAQHLKTPAAEIRPDADPAAPEQPAVRKAA